MNRDPGAWVWHAWLASAGLPSETVCSLLKEYKEPSAVYRAFRSGSCRLPGIGGQALAVMRKKAESSDTDRFRELLDRHGIGAFTILDEVYPDSLRNIPDPPAILFFQGDTGCMDQRLLAMVGSRSASYIGRQAAERLACELSKAGIGIVSGMAGGIDTAAHTGCLNGKAHTVAVTGCGLDRVYPSGNVALYNRILDNGGLLLSEYAPGELPLGWHFPHRNRILTGLSRALVLIEARIRSGSMTSVRHALDQGKDVFVYPGDPMLPHFEGNHQLLREGATYFTTSEDILEDLQWLDNHSILGQNSDCSKTGVPLSHEEFLILTALEPGRIGFEQLAEITGLSPAAIMSALTMLQVKGQIDALPGKQYQLKK